MYCHFCLKKHDDFQWRTKSEGDELVTYCRKAYETPVEVEPGLTVLSSKVDRRIAHWKDIKSRVRTHDGEMLSGSKGRDYQVKFSQRYLGKDMSAPPRFDGADHLRELAKT